MPPRPDAVVRQPGAERAGAPAAARRASAGRGAARARRAPSRARRRARGRSRRARAGGRARPPRRPARSSRRAARRSRAARAPGPGLISTATTSPASCVALPPGAAHEVERPLALARADDGARELGADALRPDRPARAPPRRPARRAARRARRDPARPRRRPRAVVEPDDESGRLVLRAHQRERVVAAELVPPGARDPVRVGVPERRLLRCRLRQPLEQRGQTLGEPPQHRVRERHRPLEPGAANELDRLGHGRVRRRSHEAELVRAEPQRRPHGRVELAHRPAAERLDPVVERANALNRPEGEPLRERAVARVEPLDRAAQHPVGVGLLLEHAQHDLVGRPPRRRDHRRPRRNSS